jgi:hypothetical protein
MRRPRAVDEEVGAPISTEKPPLLIEVGSFGDITEGDGALIMIEQGNVVFLANVDGTEMIVGVTIEQMLESISDYNRKTGN